MTAEEYRADMMALMRRIAVALEVLVEFQDKVYREMQDHHRDGHDLPKLPEVPQPPN